MSRMKACHLMKHIKVKGSQVGGVDKTDDEQSNFDQRGLLNAALNESERGFRSDDF